MAAEQPVGRTRGWTVMPDYPYPTIHTTPECLALERASEPVEIDPSDLETFHRCRMCDPL